MTWQILMFSFLLLSNYLWNFCQNEKCADIITCKTHCRKMNMSIKVCVPHHTSSQKHLLISICKALPPEPSLTPLQGLPVAFPQPCPSPAPRELGGKGPRFLSPDTGHTSCPMAPRHRSPLGQGSSTASPHGDWWERRLPCPPLQPGTLQRHEGHHCLPPVRTAQGAVAGCPPCPRAPALRGSSTAPALILPMATEQK